MTLPDKLRAAACDPDDWNVSGLLLDAAAEIERLRGALERVKNRPRPELGGDHRAAIVQAMQRIAQEALDHA